MTIVSSQIQLFGRPVTYYAVIAIAGTFLAMGLSVRYCRRKGWPARPHAYMVGAAFTLATVLRLYQEYLPGWILPFMVPMSVVSLSIAAYMAGSVIKQRLHIVFAFASPVYLGVCKVGCFLSGCCSGRPYDGVFSVCYGEETLGSITGVPLFPAQLCAAALLFLAAAAAYAMMLRRQDMLAYLAAAGFTPFAYYVGALFCDPVNGIAQAPVMAGVSLAWAIYWLAAMRGTPEKNDGDDEG